MFAVSSPTTFAHVTYIRTKVTNFPQSQPCDCKIRLSKAISTSAVPISNTPVPHLYVISPLLVLLLPLSAPCPALRHRTSAGHASCGPFPIPVSGRPVNPGIGPLSIPVSEAKNAPVQCGCTGAKLICVSLGERNTLRRISRLKGPRRHRRSKAPCACRR